MGVQQELGSYRRHGRIIARWWIEVEAVNENKLNVLALSRLNRGNHFCQAHGLRLISPMVLEGDDQFKIGMKLFQEVVHLR